MQIKINKEVSRDVLENIFVTALEGGSNYWYYLTERSVKKVREAIPKTEEECLSIALFKAVIDKGISVPFYDAEDTEELLGIISLDTIQKRLQKMIEDGNERHLLNEIDENGDAESSDAVFQYLVMQEIVFG
jgi:hypothetical protein